MGEDGRAEGRKDRMEKERGSQIRLESEQDSKSLRYPKHNSN